MFQINNGTYSANARDTLPAIRIRCENRGEIALH